MEKNKRHGNKWVECQQCDEEEDYYILRDTNYIWRENLKRQLIASNWLYNNDWNPRLENRISKLVILKYVCAGNRVECADQLNSNEYWFDVKMSSRRDVCWRIAEIHFHHGGTFLIVILWLFVRFGMMVECAKKEIKIARVRGSREPVWRLMATSASSGARLFGGCSIRAEQGVEIRQVRSLFHHPGLIGLQMPRTSGLNRHHDTET